MNANPLPAYKIKVDLTNQLTYIYRFNGDNAYEFMDVWASSAGAPETPTLQGTYTLKPLTYAGTGEWYYFKSWPCWVNYCTQISGDFCFHTPPMYVDGDYSKTPMSSISEMMYARSHGCVRLLPRQAAFMWHNMGGCKVELIYGTLTEETNRLRDELLMEIPLNSANYPDPVITDKTNYIYTYHNDTPEKLSRLTGLSIEEL
ncbi:MAG: L,D-transpeptidase, partial [Clostridiales bacterium]|nr:L,D-transpeptidase [Clostridiales bacterium]